MVRACTARNNRPDNFGVDCGHLALGMQGATGSVLTDWHSGLDHYQGVEYQVLPETVALLFPTSLCGWGTPEERSTRFLGKNAIVTLLNVSIAAATNPKGFFFFDDWRCGSGSGSTMGRFRLFAVGRGAFRSWAVFVL